MGKSSAKSFSAFFNCLLSPFIVFVIQSICFDGLFQPYQVDSLMFAKFFDGIGGAFLLSNVACLASGVGRTLHNPLLVIVSLKFFQRCRSQCLAVAEKSVIHLYIQLHNSFSDLL